MKRILVVGLPRSGSTWISQILAAAPNSRCVHEPDNHSIDPYALVAKVGLGPFHMARDDGSATLSKLWYAALHRGLPQRSVSAWRARLALRRSGAGAHRRIVAGETTDKDDALINFLQKNARPRTRGDQSELLVAKSVHGMFCLEIPTAVAEVDVVLVRRHPLNVVASWLGLGWESQGVDRAPALVAASDLDESTMPDGPDTPLTRTVRIVAILERQMRLLAADNPSWVVADHDELCRDADGGFRALYEQLGLTWHASASGALADRDTPGTGYATKRVASDLPDQWKRRLDDEQLAMAIPALERCGLL